MGAMKANREGRELLALHRVLETLVAALLKYLRALVLAVQAALAGHLALELLCLAVLEVNNILAQCLVDGEHEANDNEQERQCSNDGDVLQVRQRVLISQEQGQAYQGSQCAPCRG